MLAFALIELVMSIARTIPKLEHVNAGCGNSHNHSHHLQCRLSVVESLASQRDSAIMRSKTRPGNSKLTGLVREPGRLLQFFAGFV